MAVMVNPYDTRLILTFYVGDDDEGQPMEKTKTFSRVKPTADNEDLYHVAQALASLQTFQLVEAQRADRATLIELAD